SSSSHALVGGLVGAIWCHRLYQGDAADTAMLELINSVGVMKTLKALFLSPLAGLISGFLLMVILTWLVLPLRPATVNRGFRIMQMGSSILIAAQIGAPVSTTHVIASSIMGVGASKRVSAVRWGVARSMLIAWTLTIPISAAIAAVFYLIFRQFT